VQGTYQTFALTEASRPVLRGEQPVMLRRDPPKAAKPARTRAAKGSRPQAAELPAESAGTFERLRAWRSETAASASVPAYVVFTDATLTAIAEQRPGSVAALVAIPGIGQTKLDKFGEEVLSLVGATASV